MCLPRLDSYLSIILNSQISRAESFCSKIESVSIFIFYNFPESRIINICSNIDRKSISTSNPQHFTSFTIEIMIFNKFTHQLYTSHLTERLMELTQLVRHYTKMIGMAAFCQGESPLSYFQISYCTLEMIHI